MINKNKIILIVVVVLILVLGTYLLNFRKQQVQTPVEPSPIEATEPVTEPKISLSLGTNFDVFVFNIKFPNIKSVAKNDITQVSENVSSLILDKAYNVEIQKVTFENNKNGFFIKYYIKSDAFSNIYNSLLTIFNTNWKNTRSSATRTDIPNPQAFYEGESNDNKYQGRIGINKVGDSVEVQILIIEI